MLDTHARKKVQKYFDYIAKILIKCKMSPNHITFLALLIGLISALFNMLELSIVAIVLLWISGLFDVLDGSVARLTNKNSALGAVLDIFFDRIVEIAVIISFYIIKPEYSLIYIFLLSSIILSITIFLTVGAIAHNNGYKAFRYQAGIAERTESFLIFTLAIIFPNYVNYIFIIFILMILITIIQRIIEAIKLLK